MGYFKTHLKEQMLRKSVELNTRLNRGDVADATELSLPTISRWYDGKVDRLEAKTIQKLTDYFKCTFDDLVEYVGE